jgi:uncharacterized protein YuzE
VDFRPSKHTLRRMRRHKIERWEISQVLDRPDHSDLDPWVGRYFATVEGRELGVMVTRRFRGFLLVVTVFLVDKELRLRTMELAYDDEASAIWIGLRDGESRGAREVSPHTLVHYGTKGEVLGVEFIVVSQGIDLTDVPEADRVAGLLRAIPQPAPA